MFQTSNFLGNIPLINGHDKKKKRYFFKSTRNQESHVRKKPRLLCRLWLVWSFYFSIYKLTTKIKSKKKFSVQITPNYTYFILNGKKPHIKLIKTVCLSQHVTGGICFVSYTLMKVVRFFRRTWRNTICVREMGDC